MEALEEKVKHIEEPTRGGIIENVEVTEKEIYEKTNEEVYVYWPKKFPNAKGIIFPNDDVITIGNSYNVIVNNVSEKRRGFVILSQIYHDPTKIFENEISVKISRISRKGEPMFELYGYRGFVVKGKANIGDKIKLKVLKVVSGNQIENFLKTKIISKIE